ncbi:HU family DNA-binding protein [Actinomadura latina]|uniref:HU family DNA-binding protein n=1 Tax=Actinomadura latina TaxID=163603 RepID=A0A846ZCF6_9ACTN|nr:HU family DNA-binding protein [Actinomadura latina]NKZ07616.1 HU family DNA-binding protein [Actinomadura latina]
MNRSELVRTVAERVGGDESAARRHVDAVFDTVMERVSAGERVIVTGFGTFDRLSRPARSARNPRTGLPVEVPAAQVPRFRSGQTFRNRVAGSAPDAEPATGEAVAEEAAAVAAAAGPAAETAVTVRVEAPAPKKPKNGKAGKNAKKAKKGAEAKKPSGKAVAVDSPPAKPAKPAKPDKSDKSAKGRKGGKKKAKAAG